MIRDMTMQPLPVRVLTWQGDEQELATFAGAAFSHLDGDVAVCYAPGNHEIRLKPGDWAVRVPDETFPPMWFFSEDPWFDVLFS